MANLSILLPNKEQVDEVSNKCDEIIDLLLADLDITNYALIQTIVRMDLADKVFAIGDQITVTYSDTELTFDIIGIDHDTPTDSQFTHSLTLGLHNCISVTFNFDGAEALIYVDSTIYPDGLPAGNYAIRAYYSDNSASTTTDGYYYFTTTVDIPAGGQIRHSVLGTKTSVADVVAGTFSTYDSGTNNTALESVATGYASPDDVTVSSGVMTYGGTAYTYLGMATLQAYNRRTIDGDENDGEDRSYINYIHRSNYGNNSYDVSNIRQWLNSDAAANSWFTPQTGFDRCSATYQAYDGFMHNFDPEFLAVLGKVNKTTAIASCDNEGSVGTRTSEELFFLLSQTEVYGGNNSIAEGTAYPYYSDYSDLSAAGTGTDTNRIKYRGTSASHWWLRSPYTGHAHNARFVHPTGYCYSYSAYFGYGVAPACVII